MPKVTPERAERKTELLTMENGLKRCQAHWLFAAGLGFGLMSAVKVQAQTFEDGYQSYMRNQFPVAELQFRSAAKKAKTKEDRGFIQKFIGICQYMRGDRKSAANSFLDALNSDRNVTLVEEEVLDPGVVSFFNTVRTRWQSSSDGMAANSQKPAAPAPKPNPAAALPPAPKQAPQQAAPVTRSLAAGNKQTPPPTVEKAKPRKIKDTKQVNSHREISWIHFMPFGLGQFHNESYYLGSAMAIGQIYSIYRYNSLSRYIAGERDENSQVAGNPNILQAEKDQFLRANTDYIGGLTSDKNLAGTALIALYISGVAQSLIFAPQYSRAENENGPETSKKKLGNSIHTAWLPSHSGGTYLVQLNLKL
jgi:hypothetical protein